MRTVEDPPSSYLPSSPWLTTREMPSSPFLACEFQTTINPISKPPKLQVCASVLITPAEAHTVGKNAAGRKSEQYNINISPTTHTFLDPPQLLAHIICVL